MNQLIMIFLLSTLIVGCVSKIPEALEPSTQTSQESELSKYCQTSLKIEKKCPEDKCKIDYVSGGQTPRYFLGVVEEGEIGCVPKVPK